MASHIICMLVLCTVFFTPCYGHCPATGFETAQNFQPTLFFTGSWYTVKAVPNKYQPKNTFYCVVTTYTILDTLICQITGCDTKKIEALGSRRVDRTSGAIDRRLMNVHIPNAADSSKVRKGIAVLPEALYNDMWIVRAGRYADLVTTSETTTPANGGYDWAIITAGSPAVETDANKCSADIGFGNYGFWLQTRTSEPSEAITNAMIKLADSLFLDTSKLEDVTHQRCNHITTK